MTTTTERTPALGAEAAELCSRLDAIVTEEDQFHPVGCSTWWEEARIAVDMAKDFIRQAATPDASQVGTARSDVNPDHAPKLLEGEAVAWSDAVIDEHLAHLRRKGDDASCMVIEYLRAHPAPIEAGLREKVATTLWEKTHSLFYSTDDPDFEVVLGVCMSAITDAILSALQSEGRQP
jgi:hypothetical protein